MIGEPLQAINHMPSANDYNKLVAIVRAFQNISFGTGINGLVSLAGVSISAAPGAGPGLTSPRPFDITGFDAVTGKLTLSRCWFQRGTLYVKAAASLDVTLTTGTLMALINTNDNTCTLGMDYVYDTDVPEIFPVALYDVTATGSVYTVEADLRGSAVVMYGN